MKKAFAVVALLLVGLLLFGCTGGGQQATAQPTAQPTGTQQAQSTLQATASEQPTSAGGIKSLDLAGTYCNFKVDSLTPEKIKTAGFQGELNYAKQLQFGQLGSSPEYADKNNLIYSTRVPDVDVCDLVYGFEQTDLKTARYSIGIFRGATAKDKFNAMVTAYEAIAGSANFTNEFGEKSIETTPKYAADFIIAFYKGSFYISMDVTPKEGGLFEQEYTTGEKQVIKENMKVIARLIDENLK